MRDEGDLRVCAFAVLTGMLTHGSRCHYRLTLRLQFRKILDLAESESLIQLFPFLLLNF